MQSVSCSVPADDSDIESNLNEDAAKLHTGGMEPAKADNISKTLEEILNVLRRSTIAEERGEDVESQFWATYKKVSNEHDNDFLERANDDMGIILTFAGLFSAVNSTFIVGMQPDTGGTTNVLMLQLINIIANGTNAVNINNLSSSTPYPSSTVWTQTLAYASLAFSVLAAFGAVLGKQWLNSYKAAQGRGSLEERGIQRQKKLDGLELWHLQAILGAYLVLLQISLFLFGLSLSANMWPQQTSISSVLISTTAFGVFFYGITILVSVLRPDSPFRTPGSALLQAIFTSLRSNSHSERFTKSSAVRWILETSTNPEFVAAAALMVPRVQWPPNLDASAVYGRLLDNLVVCLDRPELFVTYGKAMSHLRIHSVKIGSHYWKEYNAWRSWGDMNRFIRDAFTDGRLAWNQLQNTKEESSQKKHKANARTALRTMVVYGMRSRLSPPDNAELIWEGDFQWCHNDGRTPQCTEFDWLVDYLAADVDDKSEGDALLALSAMHRLGSLSKQPSYIRELIRCMGSTKPSRVRYAALRAVSDAREELSSVDSDPMPQGVNVNLLDELSRAVLTALHPNTTNGSDVSFDVSRDRCYLRLIFALAKSDMWCKRLASGGHVERCIFLLDKVLESSHDLNFYLGGIFARIDPSGRDPSFSSAEETWQTLMRNAWHEAPKLCHTKECVDALPTLVIATRKNLPGFASGELANITRYVSWVLENISQERREDIASIALSSVQGLYNDLRSMNTTDTKAYM